MSYISCQDLMLGYEGKVINKHLNFVVNPGEYLCIVGENGTGKSTLIKAILGLHPIMHGEIEKGDGLLAYEIGYLPQQTKVLGDFPASVQEVVLSGCLNRCGMRPFFSKKEKRIAQQHMEHMGIIELRRRCFTELSGGQKQRVLLARAMCATRKLLLLDEPTAGLDPKATLEMYELIHQLNKEGITIIMVSHDISSAVLYASHVLHVGKESQFFGKTEDYRKTNMFQLFTEGYRGEI